MIAAYRYAFVKSLRLKSTWIILIIAAIITLALAGVLPFTVKNSKTPVTSEQQSNISLILAYSAVGSTMVILTAVFAGFRGATVFKDEVEDGSFLIMISKPINRSSLIMAKWLAFLTIMFFFALVMALFHALGIGIGSKMSVAASTIFTGIGIEFAVGIVFALIFGSIALLLSTVLSSTQTAISTLIVGVLAPITSIISLLTSTPRYLEVDSSPTLQKLYAHAVVDENAIVDENGKKISRSENAKEFTERLIGKTDPATGTFIPGDLQKNAINNPAEALSLLNVFRSIGVISDEDIQPFLKIVASDLNNSEKATKIATALQESKTIQANITKFFSSKFYEDTGVNDPYKKYVYIDFNYQATQLTSIILDYVYSPTEIAGYASLNGGRLGQINSERIQGWELKESDLDNLADSLNVLSPPSEADLDWASKVKKQLTSIFQRSTTSDGQSKSFYVADYKPFANKNSILIAYIIIAIILAPISLVIISRKNFR